MRVVIAGSRHVKDKKIVEKAIGDSRFDIEEVVCGMAEGVDRLGWEWAAFNYISIKECPADWDRLGPKAGPIRNSYMAHYADALIAIWDGYSKGTKNMIDAMYRLKKPIFIVGVVNAEEE